MTRNSSIDETDYCAGSWTRILGRMPRDAVFADWRCPCGATHPKECAPEKLMCDATPVGADK